MSYGKKYNNFFDCLKLMFSLILFCMAPTFIHAATESVEFDYTGSPQKYTVQSDGFYKLETWGAQGGHRGGNNGGYGGYSTGIVYLKRGDVLYVYVGGYGQTHQGYNGGGYQPGLAIYGGGATDIRLVNGEWNSTAGLNSRIIVAGGGGTVGSYGNSGGAGHLSGGSTGGYGSGGTGANLTAAGSYNAGFGYGGNGGSWSGGHAGAGGGGWYGGGGSYPDGSGDDDRGGGGGSSFVFNENTKSVVPSTYTVNDRFFMKNISYSSGVRTGDGYAKITSIKGDGLESIKINNGNVDINFDFEVPNYYLTVDNNTETIKYDIKAKSGFTITQTNSNISFGSSNTTKNTITIIDNYSGLVEVYTIQINKQNYYLEDRASVSYGYNYTGDYQLFYVPATGIYDIEAWGAQGGHRGGNNGGLGGYTNAKMYLVKGEKLYIYVGGSGNTTSNDGKYKGYNGGGYVPGYYEYGGIYRETLNIYGGGASDIRYNGSSLYNRVVVAGGGGSVGAYGNAGGVGGGLTGGYGAGGYGALGTPGTQNSPGGGGLSGSFGTGGNGYVANGGYGGAGGGGWYGGGGSTVDGSGDDDRGGAGGSGFVWNESSSVNAPEGYIPGDKNYLTDAILKSGAESFYNPNGSTEVGHPGNGYVRISPYLINGVSNVTINDGEIPIDFDYTIYEYSLSILDSVDKIKVSFEMADGYSKVESYVGEKNIAGMKVYEYSIDVINDITGLTVNYKITFNKQSSYLEEGTTGSYGYKYTGLPQKFIAPTAGIYTFEAWGAQGGHRGGNNGGLGGYSTGQLFLNKGQIVYIYVGSSGNNGGWNGGGYQPGLNIYGGGASDVRAGGQSLNHRILVAGGGGSVGAYGNTGGFGGGIEGGYGIGSYGALGTPGTQTTPGGGGYSGSFGQGGNGYTANGGHGGAGGGGWYGGGGSTVDGSGDDDRSGAGGSGFVLNEDTISSLPSTYLVGSTYYLNESYTKAGNTSFPSISGGTETGHYGDGYVRVSFSLEFDYEIIVSDNITVDNEFDYDIKNYNGTVDKNSSIVEFTVTDSEAIMEVVGDGKQEIHVGDNEFNIAITYINGAVEVFKYNIPREANDIDWLEGIYIDEQPIGDFATTSFNKDTLTYNVTLPFYKDEYDLTVDKGSADQIITNIGHITNKSNNYIIPISVTNETGTSSRIYNLNITLPHSSKMKKLSFVSNAGTKLSFDIPIDQTDIDIEIESYLAALYANVELYDEEATAVITGDGYIESDEYLITIDITEPNVEPTHYNVHVSRVQSNGYEKTVTYSGSVQKLIIPYSHDYLLQVWGAQGGNYGGNGGYSQGRIYLEKGTTVYLYAGGAGASGGWNGGGSSRSGYGGGASDIRIGTDSLYARVIVAGGGGGHGSDGCAAGAVGGGLNGGGSSSQGSCGQQAGGGTQTDGGSYGIYGGALGYIGSFGKGADAPTTGGGYYGGGGGGGWYGGGSGSTSGWSNGGGGGSGFIYTEETASTIESNKQWLLNSDYYLSKATTQMGSDIFEGPNGNQINGNSGNGYARISIPYQESENDFLNNIGIRATNSKTEEKEVKFYTPDFDREIKDYYIELDSSETEITISARPEDSRAVIMGLGTFDVPAGTTDYEIIVTAEAGNIKTYTVHVSREADENPYPNDIVISGLVPSLCSIDESYCLIKNDENEITEYDPNTHTYYITVPSRIKQLYLNVDPSHPNQIVNGEGKVTLNGGENTFTITVLSEKATLKDESELIENVDYTVYNYIVIRDMTGNNDLENLKILAPDKEFNYDPDITEYYVSVPNEYEEWQFNENDEKIDYSCGEDDENCEVKHIVQIYAKTDDPEASFTPYGNNPLEVGNNSIEIVVTAANGEVKSYILNIYREKNENTYLSSLTVTNETTNFELTPEYNKIITGPYYVTVPNNIDKVTINATPEKSTTTVNGTGEHNLITSSINIINITATAENGTVETYTLYITREKNDNNYLSSIKVFNEEIEYNLTPSFDKEIDEYEVDVPIGTTTISIEATLEKDTSTYRLLDNNSIKLGLNIKRIMAIAENGNTRIYTIKINRPPSDNNLLSIIDVYNSNNHYQLMYTDDNDNKQYGFEESITEYELEVENNITYLDVNAIPVDQFANVNGNGRYNLIVGQNEINIVVKSETNENKIYKIIVTRKPNSNPYLSMISTSEGIIVPVFDKENNTYTVNVNYSVESISIIATPEVNTTKVTGDGIKNINVGENTFNIVTLAEDNVTTLTYVLNVVRDDSDNSNLSDLYLEEGIISPDFQSGIITYNATVPYDVTEVTVHAIVEDSKSSYEVKNNTGLIVGENEVTVTVTSASGQTKDYIIKVLRQEQEESSNYLSNIEISHGNLNPTFNKNKQYYEVIVPYEINRVTVNAILEDENSTVTGNGVYNLKVGNNLIKFRVTGEDGKTRDYQILYIREQNTDATLKNVTIKDVPLNPIFNKDVTEYEVETTLSYLDFSNIETTDPNATYEILNNTLITGNDNIVKIKVTAANGVDTKEYVIKVNKIISTNNFLKSLSVENYSISPTFNKDELTYYLTIPYSTNSINIIAEPDDSQSTVTGDGIQLPIVGTNYYLIDVTNESGATRTYTIVVNREKSDNNYLSQLNIYNGELKQEFTKTKYNYDVEIPYEETSLDLSLILDDINSTYTVVDNNNFVVGNNIVKIIVTAQNGEIRTYTLNVLRKEIISALLENIEIENYMVSPEFNSYINDYSLTINNETTQLNITPITLDKNATYTINGNENFVLGNNTVTIEVTSSNGIDKEIYTINVNRQPFANNFLDYLYSDQGDLSPSFVQTTMKYKINVDYSVSQIELYGEPIDKSTTITSLYNGVITNLDSKDSSLGIYNLDTGSNIIKINVKSTSGIIRTYIVEIVRSKNSNNYLSSLTVSNDSKNYELVPYFDKMINDYTLTVPVDIQYLDVAAVVESNDATLVGTGNYPLVAGQNEIKISVTAENGDIRVYTIMVERLASDVNRLLDIIPSSGKLTPEFAYYTTEYTVSVASEVNTLSFTAIKEDENATITGIDSQYVPTGTSIRVITVTAENGDQLEYKITIIKESANTKLSSLVVDGYPLSDEYNNIISFNPEVTDYYITVPNDKKVLTSSEVHVTTQDPKATVSMDDSITLLTTNENLYNIVVTAANKELTQTYTIHIIREKSSNATLDNVVVNVGYLTEEFNKDKDNYTWIVPRNSILDQNSVTETLTNSLSTVTKTNHLEVFKDTTNTYEIVVTSEDGTVEKKYTFNVEIELDTDSTLSSLSVNKGMIDPEFDPETHTYDVYEYVDTMSIEVSATANSEFATILSGTGEVNLTADLTTRTILVTAEDGSIGTYTLNIHRTILKDEKLNNLYLDGLDIDLTEEDAGYDDKLCIKDKCILNPSFDSDIVEYYIKVPYEYSIADVKYILMNEQQHVDIIVNDNAPDNMLLEVGENTITVNVYDGLKKLTKQYLIHVERCLSNNTYLNNLVITSGSGESKITYDLEPEFDKKTLEYTIYVGKDIDEVNLIGTAEEPTSIVSTNGYNYLQEGLNDATVTVKSQDRSSRTYIIHIVKYGTYNNFIKNITVSTGIFWDLTPKFKSTTYEYTTIVSNSSQKATVEAIPVDSTTVISGVGEYDLVTGLNTIKLTATAQGDGSTREYTINIIRESSTNVNLQSLTVAEGELRPVFDKGTTLYELEVESDVEKLTINAIPEESTSTVKIIGNDKLVTGLNIINIVVSTEDKSASKTYQLKVTKSASRNANLTNIKVLDEENNLYSLNPQFNKDLLEYDVSVPYNIEKVNIETTPENSFATITGDGKEYLNYGINEKNIIVTSEAGDIKVYKLNIKREYNLFLNTLISDKGDLNPLFNKEITEYQMTLPYEDNEITFVAIKETTSPDVTVTGSGTYELNTGNNILEFVVSGIDGNSKTYKVNIYREKDNNNYLALLNVDGILTPTFDKTINNYIVDVRNDVTSLEEIIYKTESDNATVEIIDNNGFTQDNNPNKVIVRVTAENGDIRDYELDVMLRDDDFFSNRLSSLTLDDGSLTPDFHPDINNYAVTVSNSTSELDITAIPENERATVTGDGKISLHVGRNVIEIKVKAQDGRENIYSLVVYRTEPNDATLQSLIVKDHNYMPIFSKLTEEYEMEVGSEVDELDITAIPTDKDATVKISGNKLVSGENTVKIIVTAPDKITVKNYYIKVNKQLSKNNYLSDLNVSDYNFTSPFIKTNQGPYTVNVPSSVNSIKINATPEVSTTSVTGDGVIKLQPGKNIVSVEATSESGDSRTYTIIINKQLSNDSTLKEIILSTGKMLPTFDPSTLEYDILVTEDTDSIKITGIANDQNATVSGNDLYDVTEDFTVDIIVTAEDKTTTIYKLNIIIDTPASNYLANLVVKDGELYPNFHKYINNYTILVPNEVKSLTMTYKPEDKNASVVVTGNENFKVGTNKVYITVTGVDGNKNVYELSVVRQNLASNYLKSLTVDGYTLTPVFDKEIMYYEVTVPEDVDLVKIKAQVEDPTSTITGTGLVSLKVGDNTKYVTVESASGSIRTYQVMIKRTASNENYLLSLTTSVGEITPAFDKNIHNYTIEVPDKTEKITLSGTVSENSKVSGLGTYDIELGTVTRAIYVTSQSGEINTYTVNIVRNSSSNTNLTDLVPSVGTITPEYSNDVNTYTMEVEDNINVININAIPEDKDATVTTDDIMVLNYGENIYHVKIIAEDGYTERNIEIKINRKKDITNISVDKEKVFIDIDEEVLVSYKIEPQDTSYQEVEWKSSDETIATIENGKIKGIAYGSTTVQVISKHDNTVYASVIVNVMSKKILSDDYGISRNDPDTAEEDKTLEYIIDLEPNTTLQLFLSKIKNEETMIHVYNLDGNEITETTKVGTGFVVKYIYEGVVLDELTIIVRGDLTGDGQINNTDYVKLKNYILKKTTFNEIEMKAGDLTQSNTIVTTDYVKMKNYILKKITSVN
ncbi:MAG: cadherin-like beta sandwich domain-containing protein [Candidatus Coprovivens sp.]